MNSIEQLKMLGLTEPDFDLLVAGLDQLPHKGDVQELVTQMMRGIGKTPEEHRVLTDQYRAQLQKKEKEKATLIEDIRILQGKLLMLKRYMKDNELLQSVNEIINPKS
jgi:hypothetical protein